MNNQTGKLKWFNTEKGYGFIEPDDGTKDVFVHVTEVQKADLHNMVEGQGLSYDICENRGKLCAGNLKVL